MEGNKHSKKRKCREIDSNIGQLIDLMVNRRLIMDVIAKVGTPQKASEYYLSCDRNVRIICQFFSDFLLILLHLCMKI